MEIFFTLIMILTIPTTLYVTFLVMIYIFTSQKIVEKEKKRNIKVAVLIVLENNSICLERILNSLKNCYTEEDTIDIIIINKNGVEEEVKARSLRVKNIIYKSNTEESILKILYEVYNNYDLYISLDINSVVNESFLSDLIHGYKKGYKIMQSGYFVKNKVNKKNNFINLLFLIRYGILAKSKEKLGVSVGLFRNGYAFSKEILDMFDYKNLKSKDKVDIHLKLLGKKEKIHYIEEAKVYTDISISNFIDSKEEMNIFYKIQYLKKNFFELLKMTISGNKLIILPFIEFFLLPIEYYFIFIFINIFSQYKLYSYYSLFLIIILIFISIYKFGEKEDVYGIFYLPRYILSRIGF